MSEEKKDVVKIIPSKLERKFADWNYTYAKYIPESVNPNTITWIGFVAAMIGAIAYAFTGYNRFFAIITIIGLFVHIVCDNLDGYIARTRHKTSESGAILDVMSDILNSVMLCFCIGLSGNVKFWICAVGMVLYPICMDLTSYGIQLLKEFRFPTSGPFELHASYIGFCLLTILNLNFDLFTIMGTTYRLFDIILFVGTLLNLISVSKHGIGIYTTIKKEVDKK